MGIDNKDNIIISNKDKEINPKELTSFRELNPKELMSFREINSKELTFFREITKIKNNLKIKTQYNLSYFESYIYLIISLCQEIITVYDPNVIKVEFIGNKELKSNGGYIMLKGCILSDNDIGRIMSLENSRTPINKAINKMNKLGIIKIEKRLLYKDSKDYKRVIEINS